MVEMMSSVVETHAMRLYEEADTLIRRLNEVY